MTLHRFDKAPNAAGWWKLKPTAVQKDVGALRQQNNELQQQIAALQEQVAALVELQDSNGGKKKGK